MKHIVIINGPNLNLLGKRETSIYGDRSFDDFYNELLIEYPLINLEYFQSNHEGVIIDKLQEFGYKADGIILNAAGYTHTSIALHDTVKAIATPVLEVHISNIYEREDFRKHSFLTEVCKHHIIGKGLDGYKEAIDYFLH